jgi:acyl-CoA reductase-like NAD-dependent aldehyde dehydrogenase
MNLAAAEYLRGPAKRLLIGGRWLEASSGEVFATTNPATEQHIVAAASGGANDIDAAVKAARAALVDSLRDESD